MADLRDTTGQNDDSANRQTDTLITRSGKPAQAFSDLTVNADFVSFRFEATSDAALEDNFRFQWLSYQDIGHTAFTRRQNA